MELHNIIDKKILKKKLHEEDFKDTETLRRIQTRLAKVQTRVKAREARERKAS